MNFYVYLHRRNDNNLPFWVGKGKNNRAFIKQGHNPWWRNVAKKYGYTIELIQENLTEKEAFELEIEMIKYGKLQHWPLTNLTNGGEGTSGRIWSEESKEKMRKWAKSDVGKKILSRGGTTSRTAMGKKWGPINGKLRSETITFEELSAAGKIGGKITGPRNVESGHLARIRPTKQQHVEWGRKRAIEHPELFIKMNKIANAKRWGIEIEPSLWISKKTGEVLLDER